MSETIPIEVTEDTLLLLANRALQERGYLVLATIFRHRPGDILPNIHAFQDSSGRWIETPQKTVVIGETDEQDFIKQNSMLGLDEPPSTDGWNYYRVTAE